MSTFTIRLAEERDIAPLLAISNWAAMNTPANFAIEPEPLDQWMDSWRKTHERYPWLVACASDSQDKVAQASRLCVPGEAIEAGAAPPHSAPRPGGPPTPGPPEVIGFAKSSPHRGRCAYAYSAEVSVYIDPNWHGRGVGKALYGRLIPMLKSQGYVTLIAGISLPNAASQRLHESFGFKPAGVFHRVGWKFGRWHDVGYWELSLRDGPAPPDRILGVAEVTRHRPSM
jgi:L-amino acid N-acyltransferase YncA